MNNTDQIQASIEVLLVEDNFINQKVAQKMLQRLGIVAEVAENGLVAVNMAKDKDYDLILMDLQMPVMDGLEAAKNILEMNASQENAPKIIAVTANVMPDDRKRCQEVGMVDFIPKPIHLEGLRQTLVKWFGKNETSTP